MLLQKLRSKLPHALLSTVALGHLAFVVAMRLNVDPTAP